MTKIIHNIRVYIAYALAFLSQAVLPKEDKKVAPAQPAQPEVKVAPPAPAQKSTPYTDAASYYQQMSKPQDTQSACMYMCNSLKMLSSDKNCAIRLGFSVSAYFDKDGEKNITTQAIISAYGNGRWYKMRDIQLDIASVGVLVKEMIEAMAQDGWGCMNDSAEQLSTYLSNCLTSNRAYLLKHCRLNDKQGRLRGQISLIVDTNAGDKRRSMPKPQIIQKVSVWNGSIEPVESEHRVYFHRSEKENVKA